jgi:phosphatidylserine/phosphatidylglycerophosphate/cardiolipin synthase-like enzyme
MAPRQPNWLSLFFLFLLALAGFLYWRQQRVSMYRIEHAAPGQIATENHLSPTEDLEQIDLDRLDGAKKAVDAAMYAFTDRALAHELVKLARRGVRIRLYRDGEQYEDEQRNAQRYGDQSVIDFLRQENGIEIRIKKPSRRDLMHLKAYTVDGRLLRDGSANWSEAGEKIQDNNARFTNDPAEIRAFESDFESMWQRSDNLVVH